LPDARPALVAQTSPPGAQDQVTVELNAFRVVPALVHHPDPLFPVTEVDVGDDDAVPATHGASRVQRR
jgi:hypothetical protein